MSESARFFSAEEMESRIEAEPQPPEGLRPELRALWLCKAGSWEQAHEVAQGIETPMGSWIHGLLHLIEGDVGNSRYWYQRAERPFPEDRDVEAEWRRITSAALASGSQ